MNRDTNAEAVEIITEQVGEAIAAMPETGWQGGIEKALVVRVAMLLSGAVQALRLLWDCRKHVPRAVNCGIFGRYHVQGSALWFTDGKRFALWDLESEQGEPVVGSVHLLPSVRAAAEQVARDQRERATVH